MTWCDHEDISVERSELKLNECGYSWKLFKTDQKSVSESFVTIICCFVVVVVSEMIREKLTFSLLTDWEN